MIIVEGPDGAGKSTLVDRLKRDLGLTVGERGTANRDELYKVTRQDTYTAIGLEAAGSSPMKIWDRLFFSEMVYAPVVGRDCEFSEYEQNYVRRVLNAIACPIIVCLPPREVVLANVAGSHQMAGVADGIEGIYDHYAGDDLFDGLPFVVYYDYTGRTTEGAYGRQTYQGVDTITNMCRDFMKSRAERSW